MPPRKGWAAVYCRLSKEDEEKTARESESIRNQRALLLAWAAEHDYRIFRVYTDEDYSGIDRARPGFNAMLADARAGKFEVILAKTQSRFTRDMELVEKYLHGLFPEWGVRFIAVLDHVDTCDPAGKKARQINGLINEWYLEDLSGNVRAVLDHKRRSGSYIASFALYGYRKDPKDHSRLLPDEPAAQGVPPPSAYRAVSAGRPRPTPASLWCKATVRRILSTQTYAGDLEQGRVRKLNYKSRRVIRLPREDWIIVPGTHVPLISRADFAAVQARLTAHGGQTAAARHPLAGLVRCGVCGGKMELTGAAARRYFRCRTARRSKTACPGQPYWPLCDAEALVEKQLSRYAAAPGQLTQDQAAALLQSITVYPPQDGTRRIELRWSF